MSAPKVQMGGHMQPIGRRQTRTKQDVCDSFLEQLKERGDIDIGAAGFIEGICQHFERLPTRYALDVNIDSLDVLSHKRLLDEARLDPTTVSFAVRSVEVLHSRYRESSDGLPSPAFPEVQFTAAVPAHQYPSLVPSMSGLLSCMFLCCSRPQGEASCSQYAGSHSPSQHLAPLQTCRWVVHEVPGCVLPRKLLDCVLFFGSAQRSRLHSFITASFS